MTTETTKPSPAEINRRVALEMGWRWVQCSKPGGRIFHAGFTKPEAISPAVSWIPFPGTDEEAYTDALKAGGDPYWEVPNYCTDPAASALLKAHVRQLEGECASGTQSMRSYLDNGMTGNRIMFGMVWFPDSDGDWTPSGRHFGDADTEEMALALAFLAACDAQKATTAGESGEG